MAAQAFYQLAAALSSAEVVAPEEASSASSAPYPVALYGFENHKLH